MPSYVLGSSTSIFSIIPCLDVGLACSKQFIFRATAFVQHYFLYFQNSIMSIVD
jgi:hypothetical protein